MKSTFLFPSVLIFLITPLFLSAQSPAPSEINQRIIHVEGSASREIIPDEYYFEIAVTEFMQAKVKTDIATIEKRMLKGLDSIGIGLNQISLDRMRDLQTFRKRKNREHLTTQIYQIKLENLDKLKQMLDVLGNAPIKSVSLDRVDHSKMDQLRKEVKIEAIKAGKAKADYLLEAVGNKTGKLLQVEEVSADFSTLSYTSRSNTISNSQYTSFDSNKNSSSLSFKSIKIRFAFDLKFEIID